LRLLGFFRLRILFRKAVSFGLFTHAGSPRLSRFVG
jgi:hypothetical protein